MVEETVKRKLAAILSADVVGYSRLMGEDEAATVQTLGKPENKDEYILVTDYGFYGFSVVK